MVVNAKNTRHSIRAKEANCAGKGSPFWKAAVVIATPSSPVFQVSVMTMERPVMVQITMVSMNVPVIEEKARTFEMVQITRFRPSDSKRSMLFRLVLN